MTAMMRQTSSHKTAAQKLIRPTTVAATALAPPPSGCSDSKVMPKASQRRSDAGCAEAETAHRSAFTREASTTGSSGQYQLRSEASSSEQSRASLASCMSPQAESSCSCRRRRSTLPVPTRRGSAGTSSSANPGGSAARSSATMPFRSRLRATKAARPVTQASAVPSVAASLRSTSRMSNQAPPTFTRSSARPEKTRPPSGRRSRQSLVQYQRVPSASTSKASALSAGSV
mmetsp:Transcript_8607/g.26960  ORF Transcript_8607/g.26960 Transcript_8607/m.26960 type:complete len:230 (+) Transcript_8607:751-1440(+)